MVRISFPVFSLFIVLMLVSCDKSGSLFGHSKSGLIPKEKMIEFLVDLQLAESSMRVSAVNAARGDSTLQKPYITLFKKHGITQEQFNRSLDYYIKDIDKIDGIYNEVINRLTAMEAQQQAASVTAIDTARKREQPDTASIRKKLSITGK